MGGGVFVALALINSIIGVGLIWIFREMIFDFRSYINPLVILESIALFCYFANLKMNPNKLINWIAQSCFAVLLIHQPHEGKELTKQIFSSIYTAFDGLTCLTLMSCTILLIFIIAIIIDQPRKLIWEAIANKYFPSKEIK